MFNENLTYKKESLFGPYLGLVSNKYIRSLETTHWSGKFHKEIFCRIDETIFRELYSSRRDSRPNFPVNILVGLLIIKMIFDYSDESLLENFNYNIVVRFALGIYDLENTTLTLRTYYNFKKRLLDYEAETGTNLMEEVFKNLNLDFIDKFNISTKEMRSDSTLIWSNIKDMSRLEICLVTLRKFLEFLSLPKLPAHIEPFFIKDAQEYCYKLKRADTTKRLTEIGIVMCELYIKYLNDEQISISEEFDILEKVLYDQFNIELDMKTITAKDSKDIASTSIQNPHDPDATYRKKSWKYSKGYSVNAVETISDGNEVNIITDIKVEHNVTSDGTLLNESLDAMSELGVEKIYVDGGYDENKTIEKASMNAIELVFTGLKNKESDTLPVSAFEYDGHLIKACAAGHKPMKCLKNSNRILARFSKNHCDPCQYKSHCPVQEHKKYYSISIGIDALYKTKFELSAEEKRHAISKRCSIEGTMSQFKRVCYKDKFRFRRYANVRLMLIVHSIGLNFKRIAAFLTNKLEKEEKMGLFFRNFQVFVCKMEYWDFYSLKIQFKS